MPNLTNAIPPKSLTKAIRHLLRPLIKLFLQYQITLPYLSQVLKEVYLEVALKDLTIEGRRQTDSRLSMLTGIHRKDVRRMRNEQHPERDHIKTFSLGAQVAATWISLPAYCYEFGEPKPLVRLATQGEPSFETLVETVSKQDLRARSLLDEWINNNIVALDDRGHILLNTNSFIPGDFDEKIFFFSNNLHDYIAASASYLLNDHPPYFNRSTPYNNLSTNSITQLTELTSDRATELLKTVHKKALDLQHHQTNCNSPNQRFNLGIFVYNETQDI